MAGDLAKSNVNKTWRTSGTYFAEMLDSFVASTRLHRVEGDEDMGQRDVDFPHAYETITLHPSSPKAGRICVLRPVDNRPLRCRILAQPFGSRRAPANWRKFATFLQFPARMLPPLSVGAYVDDVRLTESCRLAESEFWWPKRLRASLQGRATLHRKDRIPSKSMRLLGADVALLKTQYGPALRTSDHANYVSKVPMTYIRIALRVMRQVSSEGGSVSKPLC